MRPANERWRYSVTPFLIGWVHTQNDPCSIFLYDTALMTLSRSWILLILGGLYHEAIIFKELKRDSQQLTSAGDILHVQSSSIWLCSIFTVTEQYVTPSQIGHVIKRLNWIEKNPPWSLLQTSTSQPGLGLALLTLSWDKNWDSHSPMNGYSSFYPRIALVVPSPDGIYQQLGIILWYLQYVAIEIPETCTM